MKFTSAEKNILVRSDTVITPPFGKKWYLISFLCGALPFLLSALTFILRNGGIFYYYSDFNAQQIPFTIYLGKHLRETDLPQFDFNAGAGLDFFGAYLFYNLFSPFTFIYALIPDSAAIYSFTFVITLKFGFCALSAYIYASRFCKTPEYAAVAAVLYAYSGYTMTNFLYHYLDSLAFFPLMLAALEAAVVDKRRCVFGLSVMLCAFTNYYFFSMEVIFIIIYFLVRLNDEKFRINFKDFCCLGAESVLGAAAAGVAVIPAVAYTLANPRFAAPFQNIKDMLLYGSPWRYARIIQAMFVMPDPQSFTNIFPDTGKEYPRGSLFSSLGMYLPLFGMSGVIAYAISNKKSRFTKLVTLLIIMAFVPVLNSVFSMGSSLYYARWMFAPVLIMSVMTAMALENDTKYFSVGIIIQVSVTVLILIFCIIFPIENFARWELNYNTAQEWTQIIGTLAGAATAFILLFRMKRDGSFPGKVLVLTVAAAFAYSEVTLLFGMGAEPYPESIDSTYPKEIKAEISGSGRSMQSTSLRNRNLLWDIPAVYTFNTIMPAYMNDYIDALGINKDDISDYYPAQCLMSGEEMIAYVPPLSSVYDQRVGEKMENHIQEVISNGGLSDNDEDSSYEDFELRLQDGDLEYYRNNNFIPMGFCYEYSISEEELMTLDQEDRAKLMLKAMVLEDNSAAEEYLSPLPKEELHSLSNEEFAEECAKRAEKTVSGYYTDDDSYNAETDFSEPELVFFSVAYDNGFTAYVDGEEVPIIKANLAFQAIPVPAGKHTIKCVYHSIPRDIGGIVSVSGAIGMAVYSTIIMISKKKRTA